MADENFRDSIATVNKQGKRNWIYPKKPSGKFFNARIVVSAFLLAFLFAVPFIKLKGQQFLLFDFLNRNFIIFGLPFGPHDFFLFVLGMIAIIVFIFLFTAVFGRVFCGWICPQTIFMEMVFRRIEYWIEGDARDQKKLNSSPWNASKFFRKGIKTVLFFSIAFVISNFLLSYIIGMDELLKIISEPPSEHLQGFISILVFSGLFYWIFAYFREQACTIVCPYGRLQGVLLDKDSIVIAYDYKRGEPRTKISRKEEQVASGDCIDCRMCVDVCPTGIDIRNGIQLECVNCTACIDACDYVMEKVNRPKSLIKYASLNWIENRSRFKLTPRMLSYSAILIIITSVLTYLLLTRTDFNINILRTPGILYQEQPGDMISNLYDLNIVNKTFDSFPVRLVLEKPEGRINIIGKEITLPPQGIVDSKFLVFLEKDEIKRMNTPITIGIYSDGKKLQSIETSFLGPVKKKEAEDED